MPLRNVLLTHIPAGDTDSQFSTSSGIYGRLPVTLATEKLGGIIFEDDGNVEVDSQGIKKVADLAKFASFN